MKRLEISRLMDEYTDTEVFPEGGSAADAQAVKERVLAQAAPAKRRRMPVWKTALLAAVLAVSSLLMIAAAVGGPVVRYISGAIYQNGMFDGTQAVSPVLVEEGRVWFIANGQRLDITDLIDDETPYLYTYTDPVTNTTTYTAVGGTVDDLGWFEYALFYDDGENAEAGAVGENYYAEEEALIDGLNRTEGGHCARHEYRPWAAAAEEALAGIDCFH